MSAFSTIKLVALVLLVILAILVKRKTMSKESDFEDILVNGISFGRGGGPRKEEDKVKTKAKKKKYITGAHGSGSARQKAKYREQRANRHKK